VMLSRANENSKSAKCESVGMFRKSMASTCFMVVAALSLLVSSQVFAEGAKTKKSSDERLGGYTLADESMLGRYGDQNDEALQSASVSIDPKPATKSKTPKKSVGKVGGYSMEDGSMLGRYGDHNDE